MLIKLVPLWYDNYKWLNTFLHSLFLFWPNSVHALLSIKLIFFEFGFFLVRFVIVHLVPHWRDEKRETGKVETSKSMFVFPTFSPHTYMNQITFDKHNFREESKVMWFRLYGRGKIRKKITFCFSVEPIECCIVTSHCIEIEYVKGMKRRQKNKWNEQWLL